jgi:amino acid permease
VNLILTAVGVGIFALPTAISNVGWLVGLFLLLLTGWLAEYMTYLIWRSMIERPKVTSYAELGKEALGVPGQVVVGLSVYVCLIAICAILLILISQALVTLFGTVTQAQWTWIAALILLPLAWLPTLKEVGIVSWIGLGAASLIAVVVCIAAIMNATDDDAVLHGSVVVAVNSFGNFAKAFTLFMNGFAVAGVVPTIINNMRSPEKFPKVSVAGFLFIAVIFAFVGFSGYLGWGDVFLQSEYDNVLVVLSLSTNIPTVLSTIAQAAIIVVCVSHFLIMFNPVAVGSESGLDFMFSKLFKGKTISVCAVLASKMILRVLLLGLCLALALLVPDFGKLVSILGATVVMLLQLIYPVVFFLLLVKQPYKSAYDKVVGYTIISIALVLAVFGMGVGMWVLVVNWDK